MWKFLILLCLLVAACHVVAGRRGNRRRGGGGRNMAGATNVTHWTRLLPGNLLVQESAYRMGSQVFVLSKDKRKMRGTEFKASKTVYDFTPNLPPVAVLKVKRRCYLMEVPQNLAMEALLSRIITFNNTEREENSAVEQFVTTETRSLQDRPGLAAICSKSRRPVMVLSGTEPAVEGVRKSMKVSTLDNILTLTKIKTRGGRNRGGSGGQGNRRKGGRRANRRRQGGQ